MQLPEKYFAALCHFLQYYDCLHVTQLTPKHSWWVVMVHMMGGNEEFDTNFIGNCTIIKSKVTKGFDCIFDEATFTLSATPARYSCTHCIKTYTDKCLFIFAK